MDVVGWILAGAITLYCVAAWADHRRAQREADAHEQTMADMEQRRLSVLDQARQEWGQL